MPIRVSMNQAKPLQAGFGLTETLLTLGAVSVLAAGIYMVLSPTSATAQTKIEQDNLQDLSLRRLNLLLVQPRGQPWLKADKRAHCPQPCN